MAWGQAFPGGMERTVRVLKQKQVRTKTLSKRRKLSSSSHLLHAGNESKGAGHKEQGGKPGVEVEPGHKDTHFGTRLGAMDWEPPCMDEPRVFVQVERQDRPTPEKEERIVVLKIEMAAEQLGPQPRRVRHSRSPWIGIQNHSRRPGKRGREETRNPRWIHSRIRLKPGKSTHQRVNPHPKLESLVSRRLGWNMVSGEVLPSAE